MEDVASRAGVSVSTVSPCAARLGSGVSGDRSPGAGRSRGTLLRDISGRLQPRHRQLDRVAVLVSGSLGTWFNGTLLDSVYATLHRAGQELLIYRTLDSAERDEFFATLPARRNADALIVASLELTATQRSRLRELRMPLVYVNQRVRGAAAVSIDDAAGAAGATRHLISLGHQRIAFVGWAHAAGTHPSSSDRLSGYRQAMAEAGIATPDQRVITANRRDEGEAVVAELLGSARRPTGLVVESDELAMSVLAELSRSGVRVPQSVSVMGFDDHAMAAKFGLSTVAQPVDQLGRQAAELALALTGDAPSRQKSITVPTRLVLRTSTGSPPDDHVDQDVGH